MLVTKLVLRLIDAGNQLLGWTEAYAEARGDGFLTIPGETTLAIERPGRAKVLSIHWCDVNVEIRLPTDDRPWDPGQIWRYPGPWACVRCGDAAGGLPPVTVRRPITIGLVPASIGAVGHAAGGG